MGPRANGVYRSGAVVVAGYAEQYSGVSAAVQAALLSMKGIKTHNDGIIEEDIEKTIRNVGIIGTTGMEQTDKTILNIMCRKQ